MEGVLLERESEARARMAAEIRAPSSRAGRAVALANGAIGFVGVIALVAFVEATVPPISL